MNLLNAATSLIQVTNIVLLLGGESSDVRKFVAWRIDKDKPQEVLSGLQVTNANLEDTIRLFEHPIETGATITDHMIVDPNTAIVEAMIANDDATTLKELEYLCLNGIPLKLRVNNKIVPRAVVKDKPFALSAETFDKTKYNITFRQEEEVDPVYTSMPPKKVTNKANASRINSGVKQAQPAKGKSWVYSVFHGGRT